MTSLQPKNAWQWSMNSERPLDRIFITDLLLPFTIGINEEEQKEKMDVLINITMWVKENRAFATENLDETVDYRILHGEIVQLAKNRSFVLIETLAEVVAELALKHPLVQHVQVRIEKPHIRQYLEHVGSAGIEIIRSQKGGK